MISQNDDTFTTFTDDRACGIYIKDSFVIVFFILIRRRYKLQYKTCKFLKNNFR